MYKGTIVLQLLYSFVRKYYTLQRTYVILFMKSITWFRFISERGDAMSVFEILSLWINFLMFIVAIITLYVMVQRK